MNGKNSATSGGLLLAVPGDFSEHGGLIQVTRQPDVDMITTLSSNQASKSILVTLSTTMLSL